MTEVIHWVLVSSFALLGAGCIVLVVMQLPGTWLMLVLGLGVQASDVWWLQQDNVAAGWWALAIGLALAAIGEGFEAAAGAAGAAAGGGRKRGMVGALIGAMIGAVVGTFLIPVPLAGSLIGAILGAFVGAIAGEMAGAEGRSLKAAFKPATGAAMGRAAGTLAKVGFAAAVWVVLVVGLAMN